MKNMRICIGISLNNLSGVILSEQNMANLGNNYLKHLSRTSARRKVV